MALWDDLIAEAVILTKRPDLVNYGNLALRQAVRMAHKSGKYWRDLKKDTITVASAQIQEVDLTASTTRFRQVAYLKSGSRDFWYDPVTVDDLIDSDRYARQNIYYGFGDKLMIRAAGPEETYELAYYQYPIVTPTSSFNSWIAQEHSDLLILWTAMTILGTVGESEIKNTLQPLALLALADLQSDNLEIVGR